MANIDPSAVLLRGSVVVGDVTLGKDVGIWYNAVIRGDAAPIVIGARSNVQDNCVIHVGPDTPAIIGEGVTIGHAAIVHGCTIGDDTMIGMGSIVMDRARVGKNCIIGAGALVTQGTVIPDNSIAFGNPAKVVRATTEAEIAHIRENASIYVEDVKQASAHKVYEPAE